MQLGERLVVLIIQFVVTLASVRPGMVTHRTMDWFYACIALGVTAETWMSIREDLLLRLFASNTLIALVNLARRSLRVVLPSNMLFAVSAGAAIHRDQQGPTVMFIQGFILFCLFPVMAIALESAFKRVVLQGLQTESVTEVLAAATGLLKSSCDIIFRVDAEGAILHPAGSLESFLLRGASRNLENGRLVDLLPLEEDKVAFSRRLQECSPGGEGLADAFIVKMRDADSSLVKVRVLMFCFRHLDNQRRFMVGLTEDTEGALAVPRPEPELAPAPALEPLPRMIGAAQDAGDLSNNGANRPADGVSEPGITLPSVEGQPAVVTLHSGCRGLHVVNINEEFKSRIGHLKVGDLFSSVVQNFEAFNFWLSLAINKACYQEEEPPCHITLKFRNRKVRAQCRLLLEVPRDMSDEQSSGPPPVPELPKTLPLQLFNVKLSTRFLGLSSAVPETATQRPLRGTPPSLRVSL